MKTCAQKIADLPFFDACHDAQQLYTRTADFARSALRDDQLWQFPDGSLLESYSARNEMLVVEGDWQELMAEYGAMEGE